MELVCLFFHYQQLHKQKHRTLYYRQSFVNPATALKIENLVYDLCFYSKYPSLSYFPILKYLLIKYPKKEANIKNKCKLATIEKNSSLLTCSLKLSAGKKGTEIPLLNKMIKNTKNVKAKIHNLTITIKGFVIV